MDVYEQARAELRARPVLAQVTLTATGDGEFVVLVARREGDGLQVVAQVDGALVEQAVKKAAA